MSPLPDRTSIKLVVLHVARACGGFALARRLTRHQLRVLAYHGIAIDDEADFRGGLFMRPETFERRLDLLVRHGYPVISLDEAYGPDRDRWPPCATVITIDDGWYGTYASMAGALHRRKFASTLYLSTYYAQKQTQVFNVAAAYGLWKTALPTLDLAIVDPRLTGNFELDTTDGRDAALSVLWTHADGLLDAASRQTLLGRLFEVLAVPLAPLVERRMFAYLSMDEAKELSALGMDVQLHTHRHRFERLDDAAAEAEIADNRAALRPLGTSARHFCYPSGGYSLEQLPLLRRLDVISATTTRSTSNHRDGEPLQIGRFMEAEHVSELEFEAQMSGLFLLLAWLKPRRSTHHRNVSSRCRT